MPYDDHLRSLLNSRSARTPVAAAFPPYSASDAFSIQTPRARESPSMSSWSESPSCYSQSRTSVDDTTSDLSTSTSDRYGLEPHRGSESSMSSGLQQHKHDDQSDMNSPYRSSYVDPLRDSSEDERTEAGGIASGSNDTLSDLGVPLPVESDTSLSSTLSTDPSPDPRLSFLGPKTRMISKAPWEEDDAIVEEALSDTETQTDGLSIFGGKLKVKGRSRSRTLTSERASRERRFLGGGWGRTSSDTRPSMDSSKKSMDSYPGAPISPRTASFSDQIRGAGRTPSLFSTSSGTSSALSGVRTAFGTKLANGLSVNAYGVDSRTVSPAPSGSPTAASFVHPYANPDLLPPGHEPESLPSRSDSSTTLTASTGTPGVLTPSSSNSSAVSPSQDNSLLGFKKEKRRPPQISVSPMNRTFGAIGAAAKSPSALSTGFSPMSPVSHNDDTPPGMLGFPGSPACNLISLEQAQIKARERSMSAASDILQPTPPRRRELTPKKSKPSLIGIGGGFSSTIGGGGSSTPLWSDDGRARTVSAGSALHGRSKGYPAASNFATQSTISVNIIQGGGIENIPEAAASKGSIVDSVVSSGTGSADAAPSKAIKLKRSGIFKFLKDKVGSNSSCNTGNPNISAPSTPIHIAHNTLDQPPPVPKVPAQFKSATLPDEASLRDKGPPPVVVSSPARRSQSDDSHTSVGDHISRSTARDRFTRANTEPAKRVDNASGTQTDSFGLKLRPLSSTFNGLPEDYLTSPQPGPNARGSSETKTSDDYGFEETNVLSPATPYFPASARSTHTHTSSGSDAFSATVDPRTPSSLGGFPPGVPRTSTDSQNSTAIIASLRDQLRAARQTSRIRITELENQVEMLKQELAEARCDRCGRRSQEEPKPTESGIVNRPRARTGGGSRTIFGANQ